MKSPTIIKFLLIAAAASALLLAAIKPPSLWANASSAPSNAGRTEGQILLSPAFPVARAGEPNQRGVPGQVAVVAATGAVVAEVTSDPQGRFSVVLPSGHYTLRLTSPRWPASSEPQPVIVESGRATKTELLFDAGIR